MIFFFSTLTVGAGNPLDARSRCLQQRGGLVHKSYGSGIHIQCRVYDSRHTLWNEGKLPAEALLRPHASKPRNPLLAAACFKAGYIDAWGRRHPNAWPISNHGSAGLHDTHW